MNIFQKKYFKPLLSLVLLGVIVVGLVFPTNGTFSQELTKGPKVKYPEVCELKIPSYEEAPKSGKLEVDCYRLKEIYDLAFREVEAAKKLFEFTDPLGKCNPLQNCTTNCFPALASKPIFTIWFGFCAFPNLGAIASFFDIVNKINAIMKQLNSLKKTVEKVKRVNELIPEIQATYRKIEKIDFSKIDLSQLSKIEKVSNLHGEISDIASEIKGELDQAKNKIEGIKNTLLENYKIEGSEQLFKKLNELAGALQKIDTLEENILDIETEIRKSELTTSTNEEVKSKIQIIKQSIQNIKVLRGAEGSLLETLLNISKIKKELEIIEKNLPLIETIIKESDISSKQDILEKISTSNQITYEIKGKIEEVNTLVDQETLKAIETENKLEEIENKLEKVKDKIDKVAEETEKDEIEKKINEVKNDLSNIIKEIIKEISQTKSDLLAFKIEEEQIIKEKEIEEANTKIQRAQKQLPQLQAKLEELAEIVGGIESLKNLVEVFGEVRNKYEKIKEITKDPPEEGEIEIKAGGESKKVGLDYFTCKKYPCRGYNGTFRVCPELDVGYNLIEEASLRIGDPLKLVGLYGKISSPEVKEKAREIAEKSFLLFTVARLLKEKSDRVSCGQSSICNIPFCVSEVCLCFDPFGNSNFWLTLAIRYILKSAMDNLESEIR
jgi:uncharacterized coiled-coil DUF342 family protein